MTFETLTFDVRDRIATITIDRPDKLNALNDATIGELGRAIDEARERADVGGVIVTGAGAKAFVAGADIAELAAQGPLDGRSRALRGQQVFTRFESSPKPTIAAINGVAYAGGLEWACWTDMAVADEHATFGVTCRRWNIGLADGGTQRLTRILGYRRAIELIITGRVIDAHEAQRIGLVNEVVPSGTCLRRALELAERITP
jgi:enoyl-CoA hydratase